MTLVYLILKKISTQNSRTFLATGSISVLPIAFSASAFVASARHASGRLVDTHDCIVTITSQWASVHTWGTFVSGGVHFVVLCTLTNASDTGSVVTFTCLLGNIALGTITNSCIVLQKSISF